MATALALPKTQKRREAKRLARRAIRRGGKRKISRAVRGEK